MKPISATEIQMRAFRILHTPPNSSRAMILALAELQLKVERLEAEPVRVLAERVRSHAVAPPAACDPTIEDARRWLLDTRHLEESDLSTLAAYPVQEGPFVLFGYRDSLGAAIVVSWDRRTKAWGACRAP